MKAVDREPQLTLIEGVVLGLLVEAPRHGFAIAKELGAGGWLGATFTAHRPMVYRAIRSLTAKGLLADSFTEVTTAGPERVVERANASGHAEFLRWLRTPLLHMRDIRVDFLVKLALHDRLGLDPEALVWQQRGVFEPIFLSLQTPDGQAQGFDRTLALWRAENSASIMRFLDQLLPDKGHLTRASSPTETT